VGDSAIYTFKAVLDSLIQNGVAVTNKANINASGINPGSDGKQHAERNAEYIHINKNCRWISMAEMLSQEIRFFYTIKVKNTALPRRHW